MKNFIKKQILFQKSYSKIQKNVNNIEFLFLTNAKILMKIKKLKLYGCDYLYPNWKKFYKIRIKNKFYYQQFIKYAPILKMLQENESYMNIKNLAILGYKKTKFLSYHYNNIIKNSQLSLEEFELFKTFFKNFYKKSFAEFIDLPYKIYKEAFISRLNQLFKKS